MHPTLDFDPYEVLGVSKTTPTKDIKLIYQQKVLRCHPDKIKNESEVDQLYFHELQRSWEILRDPETRKEYDLRSDESALEERPAISQEVDLDDMEYDEDTGTYYYDCRCGEGYHVTEDQLSENIDVLTCTGCSLLIKVLYQLQSDSAEE